MPDATPEKEPEDISPPNDSMDAINKEVAQESTDFKKAFEAMTMFLSNEKHRRLFMRMIKQSNQENTRPITWSRRSVSPYYRKHFAEELKRDLDKMMAGNKHPIIYLFADTKLSKKSLQLKINQAFMFLVEEMDTPDCYYRELRECILITNESNGIQLTWTNGENLTPAKRVAFGDTSAIKLKKDVEDFLDNGKEGTRFERNELQLNDEEVEQLTNLTSDLVNVRVRIEHGRVLIIKLTAEQLKQLEEAAKINSAL